MLRLHFKLADVQPEMERLASHQQRAEVWYEAMKRVKGDNDNRINLKMIVGMLLSVVCFWTVKFAILPFLGWSHPIVVGYVLPVAFFVAIASIILSLTRIRRSAVRDAVRRLLRERGIPLCLRCGYNLTRSVLPRCPECGREFDPAALGAATPGPEVAK